MLLKDYASQSSIDIHARVIMLQLQQDEFRKENSQLRAKEIELLHERDRLLSRVTTLVSEKDQSKRDREAL